MTATAQSARERDDAQARARYFRVLSDPTRLRALDALRAGPLTVGELAVRLGAPRSRLSNHLACLKWCGFVAAERRGREVIYRLADRRALAMLDLARRMSGGRRAHLASCERIGPDWI